MTKSFSSCNSPRCWPTEREYAKPPASQFYASNFTFVFCELKLSDITDMRPPQRLLQKLGALSFLAKKYRNCIDCVKNSFTTGQKYSLKCYLIKSWGAIEGTASFNSSIPVLFKSAQNQTLLASTIQKRCVPLDRRENALTDCCSSFPITHSASNCKKSA